MRFCLIAGLLLSVLGCVKSTDSILPSQVSLQQDKGLYVACFISPQDTLIRAKVVDLVAITTTAPTTTVRNAVVTISDGQQALTLSYIDSLDYYAGRPTAPFAVRSSSTYRLTVDLIDGRHLQADATVPSAVPINSVSIDSVVTAQADKRLIRYNATINWTSPTGLSYYQGWGLVEQTISNTIDQSVTLRRTQPDFSVIRVNSTAPDPTSTTGSFTLSIPADDRVHTRRVTLGLFSTDVNYYQYHASLREQSTSPASFFTSGPVLFSNIQGGYGVFAAYNATYINR